MTGSPPHRAERRYGGDPSSLRHARADVLAELSAVGVGADDDLCERVALVVSELATNAVEAAPGVDYVVRLTVMAGDGAQVVAVIDVIGAPGADGASPPEAGWRVPAPDVTRGRGLAIVARLSESVTTARHDGGAVRVTARLVTRAAQR